jgi:hypothetical protein
LDIFFFGGMDPSGCVLMGGVGFVLAVSGVFVYEEGAGAYSMGFLEELARVDAGGSFT